MAAITTTQDGNYIYLALQDSSGFPTVVRCARSDLSVFASQYAPGAGTAANVATVDNDADNIMFYGNFGSGIQVIKHTVSSGAETNISPSGLTTKVVNTLALNPTDDDHIWITVDTDQDLLRTTNNGSAWTTLDAALGYNATGLGVLFTPQTPIALVGGKPAAVQMDCTTNLGTSKTNLAGSMSTATNITNIEIYDA